MFDNINPATANAELTERFSNFCLNKNHEIIFINCIDAPLFFQNKEGEDLTEDEHIECIAGDILIPILLASGLKTADFLGLLFEQINKGQEPNTFYCFSAKSNTFAKYNDKHVFMQLVEVGDILNIPELLAMILQAPPETD